MTRRAYVIDIDRGWKSIKRNIPTLGKWVVEAGIFDKARNNETGKPIAPYAGALEYGAPNKGIIERPFMRRAFDKNQRRLGEFMLRFMRQVLAQKGRIGLAKVGLLAAGKAMAGYVVDEIVSASEWAEPVKKTTGVPLIDTGSMVTSVTARVTTRMAQDRRRQAFGGLGV